MSNTMRPSKLISTFGPGSIMDLPDGASAMVLGTNFWHGHRKIFEPRLAKELNVDYFGAPIETYGSGWPLGIPYRDFPFYRVCPECNGLFPLTKLGKNLTCKKCGATPGAKEPPKTVSVRLVAACINGHIQDFPWRWWIGCTCPKGKSDIHIEGGLTAGSGSDLRVLCKNKGCKSQPRDLRGALEYHSLKCGGERPWLGDKVGCDQDRIRGLLRGASNVYFPIIESSLSIPPFSNYLHVLIRDHIESARDAWNDGTIEEWIRITFRRLLNDKNEKIEIKDLKRAFEEVYTGVSSSISIKGEEWQRFSHGGTSVYHPRDDFKMGTVDLSSSKLSGWFSGISRVTKLREVSALHGFTRIEPFDGKEVTRIQKSNLDSAEWSRVLSDNEGLSPIPDVEGQTGKKWLPGAEMYGEGIFFEFDKGKISAWERKTCVKKRHKEITASPILPFARKGIDIILPRTIMIHTFAHHLIKEISFACGYSMSALRERIYSSEQENLSMYGVLIYTASPDSEGTLGGLVAQAKDSRTLENHILSMLGSVGSCSQDPLCSAHDPAMTHSPWGASCHACSQLPETSCEGLQNKILDRFTILDHPTMGLEGYFDA